MSWRPLVFGLAGLMTFVYAAAHPETSQYVFFYAVVTSACILAAIICAAEEQP
jgi:hypothetical protein